MVALMQCIHDTVYTLEHPCYATLSLSQFLQLKKYKKRKKNVFIGLTAKKGFQILIVQQKIHNIKEKKRPFFIIMSLKENITQIYSDLIIHVFMYCIDEKTINFVQNWRLDLINWL